MSPKITKDVFDEVKRLYDLEEPATKIKAYISEVVNLGKTQTAQAFKDILAAESFEIDTDSTSSFDRKSGSLLYKGTQIKTLSELLDACGVDKNLWFVKNWKANKWDTSFKIRDEEGNESVQTTPNFQVNASLELRKEKFVLDKALEIFRTQAAKNAPTHFVTAISNVSKKENKKLLVINLSDHHFGKLSDGSETGYDDYSLSKAKTAFIDGAFELLKKAEKYYIPDEILFIIGNDLLNVDNLQNTTTAGTPQSTDSRFFKVYQTVCETAVEVITRLGSKYKTDVLMHPGNHDQVACLTIGEYLKAWFKNHEQVKIINDARPRKYYRYGNNAFGVTHGNEEKHADLPLLMATECKFWSECKFREVFTGHLHQQRVSENKGVIVRIFPSLCATDSWHAGKGYVGNRRAAQALFYDEKLGLDSMFFWYPN